MPDGAASTPGVTLGADHLILDAPGRTPVLIPWDAIEAVIRRRRFRSVEIELVLAGSQRSERIGPLEAVTADRLAVEIEARRLRSTIHLATTPLQELDAAVLGSEEPLTWEPVWVAGPGDRLRAALLQPILWLVVVVGLVVTAVTVAAAVVGELASNDPVDPLWWGLAAGSGATALTIVVLTFVVELLLSGGAGVEIGLPTFIRARAGRRRRERRLPRRAVQHVVITDGPLHRRLGVVTVTVLGTDHGRIVGIRIPVVRPERVVPLLTALTGEEGRIITSPLVPRPAAAGRRTLIRVVVMLAVPGAAVITGALLLGGVGEAFVSAIGAACLTAAAVPVGRRMHTAAGHRCDAHAIRVASGLLVHRVHAVLIDRVQSVQVRSRRSERRWGLCSVRLDLPGEPGLWIHGVTEADADRIGRAVLDERAVVRS